MISLRNIVVMLTMLSFAACKKNDPTNTTIHGRVVDFDSKTPVAGMKVECYFVDGDAGVGLNLSSFTVGIATTDAAGNYSFAFTANPQNSPNDLYRISGYGKDNYYGFETEVFCSATDHMDKTLDFDCLERIPIELNITHIGPIAPADYMWIKEFKTFPGNAAFGDFIYADSSVHSVALNVTRNHPSTINYVGRRNGILLQEHSDTVIFRTPGEHYGISY